MALGAASGSAGRDVQDSGSGDFRDRAGCAQRDRAARLVGRMESRGIADVERLAFWRRSGVKLQNLVGRRFGRLRVVAFRGSRKWHPSWKCICDCGQRVTASASNLKTGHTKSCGCFRKEITRARSKTHGMTRSREWVSWVAMRWRCENRRSQDWKNYGGRGIKVCARWKKSFSAFYRDMGPRPRGRSIDRRNNDLGYSKANCRWATRLIQNRNRRFR